MAKENRSGAFIDGVPISFGRRLFDFTVEYAKKQDIVMDLKYTSFRPKFPEGWSGKGTQGISENGILLCQSWSTKNWYSGEGLTFEDYGIVEKEEWIKYDNSIKVPKFRVSRLERVVFKSSNGDLDSLATIGRKIGKNVPKVFIIHDNLINPIFEGLQTEDIDNPGPYLEKMVESYSQLKG